MLGYALYNFNKIKRKTYVETTKKVTVIYFTFLIKYLIYTWQKQGTNKGLISEKLKKKIGKNSRKR